MTVTAALLAVVLAAAFTALATALQRRYQRRYLAYLRRCLARLEAFGKVVL